ncbi:MAG: zinc-binding dehydrogenase [Planctomycetota bacterium]
MDTRTTQAAILVEQREPLTLDTIELPEQLEAGQVLVEIEHSGVCGSQLGEIAGVKGPDKWLPHLLGHEGGATVLEVGPGVRHIQPGQRVVMHWRKGVGIDASPGSYRWSESPLPTGKLNSGQVTTFQRHAVVSENRLTSIPDDVPLDVAALFGCPVTTGLGVIENDAKLKPGQSLVVWGAGGVGLNIIQGAAMVSGTPIVAIDLHDNRLKLAKRLGATHTLNAKGMSPDEVAETVRGAAILDGAADVVVDNTGQPTIIRAAYDLTSATGRTILVGVPRHDAETTLHTLPLHFAKTLTGSHGGSAEPTTDIPRYLKLVEAGKLDLQSLITHRYPLEDINQALNDLRDGTIVGRCMIDM